MWGLGVLGVSVAGCSITRVAIGVLGTVVPVLVLLCPCTFTGVAPKVALGVTLGPHKICRFELVELGLIVIAVLVVGAGGVDSFGPQLIVLAWLLVVGPCDLTVGLLAGVAVIDLVIRRFESVIPKNSKFSVSSSWYVSSSSSVSSSL